MKIATPVLSIALAAGSLWASPRYPFPRNLSYPHGIKTTLSSATGGEIQTAFESWKEKQLDSSGTLMRVKFDDPSVTVSEGIGYGMLIMVYMDNATNNTQGQFDKLWNYYVKFKNNNGLMNWKISGYNSVSGANGATDADLDVAFALLIAYKQWGNESYLTNAKTLIQTIYGKEVDASTSLLKPGDGWQSWNDAYNPSYFSPAAIELFKTVDPSHGWANVLAKNYALVKLNAAKSTAGLPSNWCNYQTGIATNGNTQVGFDYDAVRTPWRLGIGYSWFGHDTAKTIDAAITKWVMTKTGSVARLIMDGYDQSGNARSNSYGNVATFVGAFGAAAMVDVTYQAWLNNIYTDLKLAANGAGYYHSSLKVLYELYLSGNFNNFWDTTSTTSIDDHVSALRVDQFSVRQTGVQLAISGLEASEMRAQLVDLSGRVQRTATGSHELSMDVSGLSQGAYVLRLVTPQGSLSSTVVLTGR